MFWHFTDQEVKEEWEAPADRWTVANEVVHAVGLYAVFTLLLWLLFHLTGPIVQ